jgi:ubiquitin-conjugating enzyme E2 S
MTKIFHPNVAVPSGEICVNTLKKDWNPTNWSLSHIFEVVKCLLIVPFPESSLNEEAGREFMENYDDFFNNARLYTQVHARPTQAQAKLIEQHNAIHNCKGEEKKMEEDAEIGREATGGVLSQLTNSFLPTAAVEGKGENFSMDGMPSVK